MTEHKSSNTSPTGGLHRLRAYLWRTHWFLGLIAGGILALGALSGALMAFEPQISTWAEKPQRELSTCLGAPAPSPDPGLLVASLPSQGPKPLAATGWTVWNDPCRSVLIQTNRGGQYFDPQSKAHLGGESTVHGFLHGVEEFHRWLLVREPGKQIVGAANLIFGVLLLTGIALGLLPVYQSLRRKQVLKQILLPHSKSKTLRAKTRQWHIALGFWMSLPLMISMGTGLILSYEWAGKIPYLITGSPLPTAPKGEKPNSTPQATQSKPNWEALAHTTDSLLGHLQQQGQTWSQASLRSPRKPGEALSFNVQLEGEIGARSLWRLDPQGQVLKAQTWDQANAGQKLRAWIVPLHTGQAWGWFGQCIALLTALSCAFLSLSGLWLAWKRGRSQA